MKKTACAVLIFIMTIFIVNPSSSDARYGYWWGWWAPWAVIGGAAVLSTYYAPYYYSPYYTPYYAPYYVPPPVVIREQPPIYVQPAPSVPQSSAEKIFAYPRQGQSEELQAKDRYACHSWAVSQAKYDPTQPPGGMPSAQKDADYKHAMGACLEGRGYTVK
ncbi:MAG TPA: hypothetical protein VEF33_12195 [Syntrophales bacterium]|nr:hypothetical protein [Syntrophales bacterium]